MQHSGKLRPVVLVIGLLLAGCGGGGSGPERSPYAGQWASTWSDSNGYQGPFAATVGPARSFSSSGLT